MTPKPPRPPTYETFLIHTIMPAAGWHGVWWFADHHEALPVHVLALVTRYTRECRSNEVVSQYANEVEEDRRDIVSMEYNPSDGWCINDDCGNYCGLLPPGWTLVDFEGHHDPMTSHTKKETL